MKSKGIRKFRVELKQRFLSDNSELLHGEAEIYIPDRKQRELEKEMALIEAYKILLIPEIAKRNVNQAFLFTENGDFIERIETNPFTDEKCDRIELTPELIALPEILKREARTKGFKPRSEPLPPVKIRLLDRAIPG